MAADPKGAEEIGAQDILVCLFAFIVLAPKGFVLDRKRKSLMGRRLTKVAIRRACEAIAMGLGHQLGSWGYWFCDHDTIAFCKLCGNWIGFHLQPGDEVDWEDGALKPGEYCPERIQGTIATGWGGSSNITKKRCFGLRGLAARKAKATKLRNLARKHAERLIASASVDDATELLFEAFRGRIPNCGRRKDEVKNSGG